MGRGRDQRNWLAEIAGEEPGGTCSSRGILGGFDGLSFQEQCGKYFPSTLVGQKAEKGFLGGFVSPSSKNQCERSFHSSSPTSQPYKQSLAIPTQKSLFHCSSDLSTQQRPYDTTCFDSVNCHFPPAVQSTKADNSFV